MFDKGTLIAFSNYLILSDWECFYDIKPGLLVNRIGNQITMEELFDKWINNKL